MDKEHDFPHLLNPKYGSLKNSGFSFTKIVCEQTFESDNFIQKYSCEQIFDKTNQRYEKTISNLFLFYFYQNILVAFAVSKRSFNTTRNKIKMFAITIQYLLKTILGA